jgi:hypothetical protein
VLVGKATPASRVVAVGGVLTPKGRRPGTACNTDGWIYAILNALLLQTNVCGCCVYVHKGATSCRLTASGGQSEGRVGGGRPSTPVQPGQQYNHYKGQSSVEPRPWRITYALAGGSCMAYRCGAIGHPHNGGRAGPLCARLNQCKRGGCRRRDRATPNKEEPGKRTMVVLPGSRPLYCAKLIPPVLPGGSNRY